MDGPPPKRPRRTEASGTQEKGHTASPRSPHLHDSRREDKGRSRYDDDSSSKKQNGRRRQSRSPRRDRKQERSRSRDPPLRDRDRDRDRRSVNGQNKRDRSRSRDRHQPRKEYQPSRHERRLSRSRSPVRNGDDRSFRHRSPIKGPRTDHDRPRRDRDAKAESEVKPRIQSDVQKEKKPAVTGDAMAVDEDDEDAMLRRMMGFTSFKTTQNTKVPGNQIYGVRKEKKTEYRQYMNRVGGFNRPLSPSR